jgi:hypothetical protein
LFIDRERPSMLPKTVRAVAEAQVRTGVVESHRESVAA